MVIVRLSRHGAKKSPFYQVVATDSRSSRDGRYIERLGFYNPLPRGKASSLELNNERISYWISKGAQLSDRVAYLLKNYEALRSGSLQAKKAAKNEAQLKARKEKQAAEAAAAKAEAEKAAQAEASAKPAEASTETPSETGA